jgi:hypothetical protein
VERISKHRVSALGLFLGSLVLNDIPVLNQDSVFHADNIRRDPVDRQPEAREAAVDDDEVSLCYDYSRLIPEGGRNALDQVEETVAARFNVRTVLNLVGRPEALRCCLLIPEASQKNLNQPSSMWDNRCTLSVRMHKLLANQLRSAWRPSENAPADRD